jgi:predicted DNA-binding ArsR family transcriptional regulator
MSALADIIFDPTTNADNLKERLSKVDKLLEIANQSTHDLGS